MLKEKIKLLERDLGEVAVEPVHDEEKPVELTPEVENEDTYPTDEHEQAEEVKETLVESLNSLSRTEMISFLESLQPKEWKLLIKENWFTDILKKFGKKARERKRAKKILEQHAEEASVETDIDIYSLDIIEILSGLGVKTMGALTDVQKNAFMNFLQTLIEEEAEAFVPVEVDSGVAITKIPTEEVK
jgi:hypothetical protein